MHSCERRRACDGMMDLSHESSSTSPVQLEALLRDLLSLLALPALWTRQDPTATLVTLAEALETIVRADFVYVRANVAFSEPAIELARIEGGEVQMPLAELHEFVRCGLGRNEPIPCDGIPGLGGMHALVLRFGYSGDRGVVVVGARRSSFPTAAESVFIQAAVSLAATGVETAQAFREREDAVRVKDEFLAMLGHELRNPLAPITTALQLMRLRKGGDTSREQEVIARQVAHLSRLVDDLLDISRVARGRIELRREVVALRQVVEKAVETASPLLEQRHHHLDVAVSRTLRVHGDPVRLAQVVANLVTNAAKYTEPGGHLRVSAERSGASITLYVEDDGVGIAPELLPHIFDMFVQGRTTLHRSEGGLGIGLSLVKNLVLLHGGSVRAESAGPGQGSRFCVTLPAWDGRSGTLPCLATPEANQATRRERILCVDDNEDAAQLLGEVLRFEGHEVIVVHDGVQAIEMVETLRPTVIILDIGLPVLDGYEVARRIRSRLGDDTPRLIAVTGYGQETDRRQSEVAGFDCHLVKPVDLEKMRLAIANGRG